MPDPRLYYMFDPEGRPSLRTLIERLRSREDTLVITTSPGGPNGQARVACDLDTALGRRDDLAGAGLGARRRIESALFACMLEGFSRVVVIGAEKHDKRELDAYVEFVLAAGCDLWLVAESHAFRRGARSALQSWGFTERDLKSLPRVAGGRRTAARSIRDFPCVPRADFSTFRASCQKLLSKPDFDRVDAQLYEAFSETTEWCSRTTPDVDEVAAFLQGMVFRPWVFIDELVVRIRGAQIAFFHSGYLVKLQLDRFLSLLTPQPPALDQQVAERLSWYCDTAPPAAAALLLEGRLDVEGIADLIISDIPSSPGALIVRGTRLNEYAARFVRAHRMKRQLEAADEQEALFAYESGRRDVNGWEMKRCEPFMLGRFLRRLTAETGVYTVGAYQAANGGNPRNWIQRRGVMVGQFRHRR